MSPDEICLGMSADDVDELSEQLFALWKSRAEE
jgi:hypothetical protein